MEKSSPEKKKKLVVITIPAYNEEKNIGKVLNDIKEEMEKSKISYKILVIDDGSKDRTAEIAKNHGAIVKRHPANYGLAEAFRTEMKECLKLSPDIIVHTDADGQYLAKDIPRLIKKLEQGYDLVLGSRFKGKIESMPWIKKWGNRQFSKVITKITKQKITDGQTGFRAFTREIAKLPLVSSHTYTQEQIIRASKEKYRIAEIPVYFAKRGKKTKSRLIKNPFEYALKAWINILRTYRDYEPLKFFGLIGLFLIALGFVLGSYILYTYLFISTIAIKNKIPTLVLIAILVTTGIQILLFGFLADQYKK